MLDRWYAQATLLVVSNLSYIAVAFAATLLSLYGVDITRRIKRRTRKWPFLARTSLFIVVVGFCFGALVLAATPLLSRLLLALGRGGVIPLVFATAVGLGLLAERRHHI